MLSKLAKQGEGFFRSEQEKDKFFKEFKKDMLAGGLSGAAVQVVTHPLDTSIVKGQTGSKAKLTRSQHLKTIGKKIGKGTLASAVGFPVFTSAAYLIDRRDKDKEKNASLKEMVRTPGGGPRLRKLYHYDDFTGVGQTQRNRPTTKVIDNLINEFINRPPPPGVRKEKYIPIKSHQLQKTAAIGSILNIFSKSLKGLKSFSKGKNFNRTKNFSKGLLGGSMKGKSAKIGLGASFFTPMASDINKGKTLLENTTTNTFK